MTTTAATRYLPAAAGALAVVGALYAALSQRSPSSTSVIAAGLRDHTLMATRDGSESVARPATIVRPVSCERLPDVPGKSITTALVIFPPGAYSPRHRHPGSVAAYVLKGRLRSQLLGGDVGTYSAGQSWFEPPGAVHLFAENASAAEPAELLAIFIANDDCGPLVIPDAGAE